MARHPLFTARSGWDVSKLPPPLNALDPRCHEPEVISAFHASSNRNYATLHTYITRAVMEYAMGENSKIGLVSIGAGAYATEWLQPDGTTVLFQLNENGTCRGSIKEVSGRYSALPTIGGQEDTFDLSSIMLAALMQVCDKDADTKGTLDYVCEKVAAEGTYPTNSLYKLSDAVYFAITTDAVRVTMAGGNINMLSQQTVKAGALNGTVLCGAPVELTNAAGMTSGKTDSVKLKDAIAMFKEWRDTMAWTPEENKLIPSFPDDYPVPPEAIKMASRYVNTHNDRRPMVNFMWRGVTSYGKSTGVELMAAMLNMPLLRMTCHSTMETQDFLSNIVPISDPGKDFSGELPSFTEIEADPESAYEKLTGTADPDATGDMCLEAYANAVASRCNNGSGSLFKQVESNYVKALANGYIVEVQEISRIKDSGVLVGINEYDRPGAIIPLVDGSYVRRHPNAMVCFTDNVGYVSCRPVDPSVLRRMAFVIDSYELPQNEALKRVVYNTGFEDKDMLNAMYKVWEKIKEYCADRDITEGTVSLTELEMWAQSVMADGYGNVQENCIDCVVSKATSVVAEQKEIISSVLAVHLNI